MKKRIFRATGVLLVLSIMLSLVGYTGAFAATSDCKMLLYASASVTDTPSTSATVAPGDKVYIYFCVDNTSLPGDTSGVVWCNFKVKYDSSVFSIGNGVSCGDFSLGENVPSTFAVGQFDSVSWPGYLRVSVRDPELESQILTTNSEMRILRMDFTAKSTASVGDYEFTFEPGSNNADTYMTTYNENNIGGDGATPMNFSATYVTSTVSIAGSSANAPIITAQPLDINEAIGDTQQLTVSATASGTLSYQWYSNSSRINSGGTEIVGETNESFTPPSANEGTSYYYCVVTNSDGGLTTASDPVSVTVSDGSTHTVTYDPNGGTGTMDNQTGVAGESLTLRNNTFTRTGYSFGGWATSAGGAAVYTNGQTITMPAGGLTLYAVWATAANQTISYNANGGTGTMAEQTALTGASVTLTANTFTREGYSFGGWATSVGGTAVYTDTQTITMPSGGLTLYAVWNVEITGFAAIADVAGGTAAAPTYADVAAVIAALPTNVTANTASGTVSVPVTTWTDTDTYNSAAAGSYTFTATLGTIPADFANSGNYTATVEVVIIASGDPAFSIVGSATSPNLRKVDYTTGGTTYHLIRGLNPLGEKVNAVMQYFKVDNGYWKLYKFSSNTYTSVDYTDTTSVVGNCFKIEIYKNDNTLYTTYYIVIMGDMNSSGTINASDTLAVRNHVIKRTLITNALLLYSADLNSSTTINASDTLILRNHVIKKSSISQ